MSLFVKCDREILYFIQFLLPVIAFCVSEELVILITPCPLSALNCKRLQGISDISTWNEKRGSGWEVM